MDTVTKTARSSEIRLDDLEKELLSSQARIDMVMSLLKWTAGFAFASFLAVVVQMFTMGVPAEKLHEKVDAQGAAIGKLQGKMDAVVTAIQDTKVDMRDGKKDAVLVREKMETQALHQELKADLRDIRRDMKLIREEVKKTNKGL